MLPGATGLLTLLESIAHGKSLKRANRLSSDSSISVTVSQASIHLCITVTVSVFFWHITYSVPLLVPSGEQQHLLLLKSSKFKFQVTLTLPPTNPVLGIVGDAHNTVNQCCTNLPFFNKCMIDFCTYAYGYRIISAFVLAVPAVLALRVLHTPTQIYCSKKPGVRFTITVLYISQNVLAIDFLHYYTGYHQ